MSSLCLLLALFTVLLLLWVIRSQWLKYRRLESRMEVLSARLNPHFFSNSLNAIESLVNLDQKRAASKYIIHFSHLMRKVLLVSRAEVTSLSKELAITKHYLAMEELRFKDKLTFEIKIATEIPMDKIEVPSLIFQNLLEQAINERILKKDVRSILRVEVSREGSELCCIITDEVLRNDGFSSPLLQMKYDGKNKRQVPRINHWLLNKAVKVEEGDLQNEHGEKCGTHLILRLPFKIFKP